MNAILAPEVSDVLTRATVVGNVVRLPSGPLPRPLYEAINKVLVLAGGKWSRKDAGHVFPSDPSSRLVEMLGSGVSVDVKKKYQAFFTPADIAEQLAKWAYVEGEEVLEPSAGHGSIANACLKEGASAVSCVEINSESAAVLRKKGFAVEERDFLELPIAREFSRIVMNPPFTKDQDILHVERALEWLAEGGVLVSVMSPNVSRAKFKRFISGLDVEITDIEQGAFKASGTSIRTVAIRIVKPRRGEPHA